MKVVFVFHYGRCGSTVLAQILHKVPNVLHFNEYLSTTSDFTRFPRSRESLSREDGARNAPGDIAAALREDIAAFCDAGRPTPDFVFFELKNTDFLRAAIGSDFGTFLEEFTSVQPLATIVHLYRLNLLRLSLSHIQGHRTGIWHSAKNVQPSPHTLDVTRLKQAMAGFATQTIDSHTALESRVHMDVCYERDIYADPYRAVERIFSNLGGVPTTIAQRDVRISLKKTNDFPLSDIVSNFDELSTFIATYGLPSQIIADDQRAILESGQSDMALLTDIRNALVRKHAAAPT